MKINVNPALQRMATNTYWRSWFCRQTPNPQQTKHNSFTCQRVTAGLVGFGIFALFVFLSIPVPEGEYNTYTHQVECKPSGEKFTPTIHQIWLNYSAFPEEWAAPIAQCRELNKGYAYRRWSAKEIEEFLEREYPWILETYHAYPYNVQRVDAARLFILYHYGGVYMDMDLSCVKSFDDIVNELSRHDVILSRGATFGVSNHIMLAKPRHPYMKLAIETLPDYNRWFVLPYITIMYSAGPGFLTVILKNYPCKEQVYVFPREPEHNVYYTNLHGGTWHTWDTKIIDGLGAVHKGIKRVMNFKIFIVCLVLAIALYAAYRIISRRSSRPNGGISSFKKSPSSEEKVGLV